MNSLNSEKKQKIYLYVFLILIIVIVLIWYFGFHRFSSSEKLEPEKKQESQETETSLPNIGEIDEGLLENNQELSEFNKENIGPIGRDNPFASFERKIPEESIQPPQ